jgi:hypothetical protein
LGPGKGYFYKAVQALPENTYYAAIDRNESILQALGIKNTYHSELPSIPKLKNTYDIIYCSYLVEHLKDGVTVYQLLENLKPYLSEQGKIILLFPDCEKQKLEFWNMDYTHVYPTTRRNMAMITSEAGLEVNKIIRINGLITPRWFQSSFVYYGIHIPLLLYKYTVLHILTYPFLKTPLYSMDNIPYRIYCLFRQENLMLVASKKR